MSISPVPPGSPVKREAAARRSHEQRAATQVKIVEATERLLAVHSARDLSVELIVGEAGLSKATFYHYFESKWSVVEHLVATVMEVVLARVEPFVGEAGRIDIGGDDAGRSALSASIAEGCRIWSEHRAVLRAVAEHWREVPELKSVWLGLFRRFQDAIAEAIDRERAAGRGRPGPPSAALAATLLWSTAYCLYAAGLKEIDAPSDEADVRETVTEIWLSTVYLDDARPNRDA